MSNKRYQLNPDVSDKNVNWVTRLLTYVFHLIVLVWILSYFTENLIQLHILRTTIQPLRSFCVHFNASSALLVISRYSCIWVNLIKTSAIFFYQHIKRNKLVPTSKYPSGENNPSFFFFNNNNHIYVILHANLCGEHEWW